jgi:hypothetical protein
MSDNRNPFKNTLDWALQEKRACVHTDDETYIGWVERVHHARSSVVMHDATTDDGEYLASVFVRDLGIVEVVEPGKRIEYRCLHELEPHPEHSVDITPRDDVVRRCYRNKYASSFPVVRENGTIINGHKRVKAARVAGLERHAVEVIDVNDAQAWELFRLAHRAQSPGDGGSAGVEPLDADAEGTADDAAEGADG